MKRQRITVYPASTTEHGAKPIERIPFDCIEDWTEENGGQWVQTAWVRYKGGQLYVARRSQAQDDGIVHTWGPWLAYYFAPKRGNAYYLDDQKNWAGWPYNVPTGPREVR